MTSIPPRSRPVPEFAPLRGRGLRSTRPRSPTVLRPPSLGSTAPRPCTDTGSAYRSPPETAGRCPRGADNAGQRDLQKSSAQEASLILTVLLPGAALRTGQALSEGSSTPACNALRKPRERFAPSDPLPRFLRRCAGRDTARFWPRSRRGPARGRTRRTGGSARTAPLELWNLRSAARAFLRCAGRGNLDEWNAGAFSLAFQNVEEFPPTLLRNRPVQASLSWAPTEHVSDFQRFHRNEIVGPDDPVRVAVEFLPPRFRHPLMGPCERRPLLPAALRSPPAAGHRALLPADRAPHPPPLSSTHT